MSEFFPKVLIVSEGYGRTLYGVAQVLLRLTQYLLKKSINYRLLVAKIRSAPKQHEAHVYSLPSSRFSKLLNWHLKQKRFIIDNFLDFAPDIIHIHGIFTFIQRHSIQVALKKNVPCLLSPHGMLEPWIWQQKGKFVFRLKRLIWIFFLKPTIGRVDYLHAITKIESDTLTREFPNIPQIQIPNAVDIDEFAQEQIEPQKNRFFLFLGRLHPVKAVDILIKAFVTSNLQNFHLVLAGPDSDPAYSTQLKTMVSDLGISSKVSFVGPVMGSEKSDFLRNAWCTVVPSYSEVMAMVNLESAASFTPTITTTKTGLDDWEESGGLLIEPNLSSLTNALLKTANWTVPERLQRGLQSRRLVEKRYCWEIVGNQWVDTYQMMAQSTGKKHGK